jgi:hypothetical protein
MRDEFKNALHKMRESYRSDDRLAWNETHIQFSSVFDNLVFDRAGGACPVQANGTYQEQPFYFRYRWGFASLGLGNDPILNPEYESSMSYGAAMDGFLNIGEFKEIFKELLIEIIKQKAGKENGA